MTPQEISLKMPNYYGPKGPAAYNRVVERLDATDSGEAKLRAIQSAVRKAVAGSKVVNWPGGKRCAVPLELWEALVAATK